MQYTNDFDLEEIECQLYSHVYHSTEDWNEPELPAEQQQQQPNEPENSTPIHHPRQISKFSLNNLAYKAAPNSKRYWAGGLSGGQKLDETTPREVVINPVNPLVNNLQNVNGNNKKKKKKKVVVEKKQQNLPAVSPAAANRYGAFVMSLRQAVRETNSRSNETIPPPTAPTIATSPKVDQVIVLSETDDDDGSVCIIPEPVPIIYNVEDSDSEESPKEPAPVIKTPPAQEKRPERILETERTELLFTPDSTTNDFLDNDITSLNKTGIPFNFNLHGSDLDLTHKETQPLIDLYETESSCSEAGPKSSHLIFNPVDFSPTKEIFHEPDLTSFSNFITPVRKPSRDSPKIASDEYDSDPTTLKKKKKNKKKSKKKSKPELASVDQEENPVGVNSPPVPPADVNDTPPSFDSMKKKKSKFDKNLTTSTEISPSVKKTKLSQDPPLVPTDDTPPNLDSTKKKKTKSDKTQLASIQQVIPPQNTPPNTTPITPDNTDLIKTPPSPPPSNLNFSFMEAFSSMSTCNPGKKPEPIVLDNIIVLSDDDDTPISNFVHCKIVPKDNLNIVLNVSPNTRRVSVKEDEDFTRDVDVVWNPLSGIQSSCDKRSFRDFWTEDMTKFYDHSWGQENYDLNAVYETMSVDQSKWKIIVEDKFRSKSPRKRGPMCHRCREYGHMKNVCPRYSGPVKCSLCGRVGHYHTRCPNAMCTTCGNQGGYHTTSCQKCAQYNTIRCTICNMYGHPNRICPDLWRRYHLTTTDQPILNTSPSHLKPKNKRWCSNCAKQGHFNFECRFIGSEHLPTTSQIISYDPCYDTILNVPAADETAPPPIPALGNYNLNDIRNLKNSIINSNRQKYLNIVKLMKRKCRQYSLPYVAELERFDRTLQKQNIPKKIFGRINELWTIIESITSL